MMNKQKTENVDLICIGGASWDCQARARAPIVLDSSNPVRREFGAGGVARNVAAQFARLGGQCGLVSRVGRDREGGKLVKDLADLGVVLDGVTQTASCQTASYTAILDPQGGLHMGIADMDILDTMSAEEVLRGLDRMPPACSWFCDCNISERALEVIIRSAPSRIAVAVDLTSVAKCHRVKGMLGEVDILFANMSEAGALLNATGSQALNVEEAATALRDAGVKVVVVLAGPRGAYLCGEDGGQWVPALGNRVKSVTGAGDAVAAGFLYGITRGYSRIEALKLGMSCAAYTIECTGAVPGDLDLNEILERAGVATKSKRRSCA